MTIAKPIVAVVPFGARGRDGRAGAVGRQLARRLVDRFAGSPDVELRPVFLVAMGETKAEAGYLIFGSTPDAALAASYGRSLGTTHALTGLYHDEEPGRALTLTLVSVADDRPVAERELAIAPGRLPDVEGDLAEWLGGALGITAPAVPPPAANETAYRALLDGLDEEVNATLLRSGDPAAERSARSRAFAAFAAALRADHEATAAEERILVLAAESIERGDEERAARALEDVVEVRPTSWRVNYLLGQLRIQIGETSGAIVALEHANALRPLGGEDLVVLAELYLAADAPGQAASHLRRVGAESGAYGRAQELLGLLALGRNDVGTARAHFERAAGAGTLGARLHLARTAIAEGDLERAKAELGAIVAGNAPPEITAQARRLILGVARPDLEADLERAGRSALSADGPALDEARAAFERIVAFDAELWEAHFGIGLIARRRDDHAAAARAFRRVLELSPDQPDALHELGVALLASGAEAEALRVLDQAATLRPKDAGYLADAGFAHLRAGELAAARERLRLATSIDAEDPLTRSYLAELERAEAAVGKPN